jgi:hypothetical protein
VVSASVLFRVCGLIFSESGLNYKINF